MATNIYNSVINILLSRIHFITQQQGFDLRSTVKTGLTTKEIAVISIFASLWIASQIVLGPLIHSVTHVSGVINRVLGWSLMLILARLSGKIGRVSLMSLVASLVTRVARRATYGMVMFFGYSLGGAVFDLLYFFPIGFSRRTGRLHAVVISALSGTVVLVPYVIFKFWVLEPDVFAGFLPYYGYSALKGTILSIMGGVLGLLISPKVEGVWLNERPRPD